MRPSRAAAAFASGVAAATVADCWNDHPEARPASHTDKVSYSVPARTSSRAGAARPACVDGPGTLPDVSMRTARRARAARRHAMPQATSTKRPRLRSRLRGPRRSPTMRPPPDASPETPAVRRSTSDRGDDVSREMVDSEAGIRTREVLIRRLGHCSRRAAGTSAAVSRARDQPGAGGARGGTRLASETRGRVAMSGRHRYKPAPPPRSADPQPRATQRGG